jgi:uncharacterized membrane-anchored protein
MKICATTLGETAGDLLSMTLDVGYAISSLILISVFVATLFTQLVSRRYHPALYWIVILSTSTAGTTMSDFMDRTLGLGYATGLAILIAILLAIFAAWYFSEKSLSVDRIATLKGELFYWFAILFLNAGHRTGRLPGRRFGIRFRRRGVVDRRSHCSSRRTQVLHQDFDGVAVLGGVRPDPAFRCAVGRLPDQTV